MAKATILLIEDDPAGREVGGFNLEQAGYAVEAVADGEEGIARFDPSRHAMVVTDLRLPTRGGMEVLRAVKERAPGIPVLIVTAYGDVETAVEAMKHGAFDFIGKPFSREQLLLRVSRALSTAALEAEIHELRARASGVERPILSSSASMRAVLAMTDQVAASDATVLVTGETGTGKELVARRLHARSPRHAAPFVVVNCAAIPNELIESELFGHEKGSFTGAHRARRGRFRQAEGGTLFLDEVGELPLAVQGRLLRVLQEGTVDVLGSDTAVKVDVRVVAATNRNIDELVDAGRFRRDLLYRLNVIEIRLPPLRERKEEVATLTRHFVDELAPGRELEIPREVVAELERRDWPGNVRGLRNACERMVVLCRGDTLSVEHLPPLAATAGAVDAFEDWPELPAEGFSLVDLEKRVIERVLELKRGNVTQAANYLRVPRHILAYRMVKYGLRRDD